MLFFLRLLIITEGSKSKFLIAFRLVNKDKTSTNESSYKKNLKKCWKNKHPTSTLYLTNVLFTAPRDTLTNSSGGIKFSLIIVKFEFIFSTLFNKFKTQEPHSTHLPFSIMWPGGHKVHFSPRIPQSQLPVVMSQNPPLGQLHSTDGKKMKEE